MNKSNKQNKKALTLSSKEILKIFRERCDRADLVWRRAFRKVLDTIQELCSKCTTNEQFDHYINELVLYSAFMHFETETLLYGLLKMSELEHRDANMVLDGKLGSFTSTPPQLEDIKRKLTLCSVAGLSHLVKIGEVAKSYELQSTVDSKTLLDLIRDIRTELTDVFENVTRAFRCKKKVIKFSALHHAYECSYVHNKSTENDVIHFDAMNILVEAYKNGRNISSDLENSLIVPCSDSSFMHEVVVASYHAELAAAKAEEKRLSDAFAERKRIAQSLRDAKKQESSAAKDRSQVKLPDDIFSTFVGHSEVDKFDVDEHEKDHMEAAKKSHNTSNTSVFLDTAFDSPTTPARRAVKKKKARTYASNNDDDFIAPEDYQSGDSDKDDSCFSDNEFSNKRRKLANNSVSATATKIPKTPGYNANGEPRRKRHSLQEDYIEGVNLDLSVIESAFSEDTSPADMSLGTITLTEGDVNSQFDIVDQNLSLNLDLDFKRFLLQHMKFELFKEITLERAVIAYCAKKRQVLQLAEDTKLSLDWKDTVNKLGQYMKDQFANAKNKMLLSIELELTAVDLPMVKQQNLLDSKKAISLIEKSVKRKIHNIEHSLITKIINYWLALESNISQLKPTKSSLKRTLFDTKSRYYDILSGNSERVEKGNDIDSLMYTMQNTECDAEKMRELISIIDHKDPDNALPMTQTKIDKYMKKKIDLSPSAKNNSTDPNNGTPNNNYNNSDGDASNTAPNSDKSHSEQMHRKGLELLKEFLKTVFDVTERSSVLCLKLQPNRTSKNPNVIEFLRFLLRTHDGEATEILKEFQESTFYSELFCNFYIPFDPISAGNTMSDGFCFYRAAYQLYLRFCANFELSEADMKKLDRDLRSVENNTRREFYAFLNTMSKGMANSINDSKTVRDARFTFFNMKNAALSHTFWGCLDWISSLHFNCSGFGASFDPDPELVNWKRFWCSSLLDRKVADIGSLPSFAEIDKILSNGCNFMVHHNAHFCPSIPATREELFESFRKCVGDMLENLMVRVQFLNNLKNEESHSSEAEEFDNMPGALSFSDVLDGIVSNNDSIDYRGYFHTAQAAFKDRFAPKMSVHEEKRELDGSKVKQFANDQERRLIALQQENDRLKEELKAYKLMIGKEKEAIRALVNAGNEGERALDGSEFLTP